MSGKRPARGGEGGASPRRLRAPVVPIDAEDIAMARLQAHLRKTEAIRGPQRPGVTPLTRTTVRLSQEMLQHVRDRARREGATVSKIVEAALERYLRLP